MKLTTKQILSEILVGWALIFILLLSPGYMYFEILRDPTIILVAFFFSIVLLVLLSIGIYIGWGENKKQGGEE